MSSEHFTKLWSSSLLWDVWVWQPRIYGQVSFPLPQQVLALLHLKSHCFCTSMISGYKVCGLASAYSIWGHNKRMALYTKWAFYHQGYCNPCICLNNWRTRCGMSLLNAGGWGDSGEGRKKAGQHWVLPSGDNFINFLEGHVIYSIRERGKVHWINLHLALNGPSWGTRMPISGNRTLRLEKLCHRQLISMLERSKHLRPISAELRWVSIVTLTRRNLIWLPFNAVWHDLYVSFLT